MEDHIPKEASDPANWGMAKSMMMGAQDAGYDISNQESLDAFVQKINQQSFLNSPNKINTENTPKVKKNPYKGIGRNEKINVIYADGTVKRNIKFKRV